MWWVARVRVKVLLFATYADYAGRERIELTVPPPATVADVLQVLRSGVPGAERIPERPLAALNRSHAPLDATVADGDELALLPPLAGG